MLNTYIVSRLNFVLTMVNDGFNAEQISDYLLGIQEFRSHVLATYEVAFEYLDKEEQLRCIGKVIDCGDKKSFFVSSIKSLSLRHFMTSENYILRLKSKSASHSSRFVKLS